MNINYSTEDLCSICYEPYGDTEGHDAYRLKCQHAFGRSCIKTWATIDTTCPACRSDIFLPEKRSGGSNKFRRLLDRTIFVPDCPGLNRPVPNSIGVGVFYAVHAAIGAAVGAVGATVGVSILAAIGASAGDVAECLDSSSYVFASLGAFRAITVGRKGVVSSSIFLTASACCAMISCII